MKTGDGNQPETKEPTRVECRIQRKKVWLLGLGIGALLVAALLIVVGLGGAWLVFSKRLRSKSVTSEKLIDQVGPYEWWAEIISPNHRRIAYNCQRGDKQFIVVDGEEGKPYDSIGSGSLLFSPDSQHVAHWAVVGDRWLAVVDGEEGKPYDGIGTPPLFSPDSQHVAYLALAGDKQVVVVDGKKGKPYDNIMRFEGRGIIFDSADSLHYLAQKGLDFYLVEEKLE